jgi:hypothetical protein
MKKRMLRISAEGGSKVDMDATWGLGFGIGYNFTDHYITKLNFLVRLKQMIGR